ncbi:hypothetical protein AGR3A_Cc20222 [Agrobacterium tomkonis CFBP 6623]|uniref:Uncharacterized protein n=1 Tax=Agrobacterium tomkonis CFBP 6623 TaxID=1183432 RepID=A0A1S7P740_9HYPH|nr:hypothetical protein AGR3A_Cc20222 [Agrobacterium tomkonis CFBP 6623]
MRHQPWNQQKGLLSPVRRRKAAWPDPLVNCIEHMEEMAAPRGGHFIRPAIRGAADLDELPCR